ncbi:MAG: hypothetical protein CML41_03795 [Rhodobacteraceae bacterium]|nr:hypothetical protein [Paracoccaceae bacterium]|tara:strand:- start:1318 stop:2007 length:690 start_codon:yes stop_codon:yes gene_type:complete
MSKLDKLSRRGFLCLCLMPSIISASPLVQLQGGHGLFSKTNSNSTNKSTKKFSLFHDPEPELDPTYSWDNLVQKPAMILTTQNVALLNANTKETLRLKLKDGQTLSPNTTKKLNYFLRDWRTNQIKNLDEAILCDFLNVCGQFSSAKKFLQVNVHSGFRSYKTNNYLRARSHKVAKNSLHTLGKAIDFSIPGKSSRQVAQVARSVSNGGVGHYPSFVHLDSGPKRMWRS